MGETIFNFTLRTLECTACGAPVVGTIAGGQARCQYCGAQMLISARPREQREATQIDEASRIAGLRAQLASFDPEKSLFREPDELAPFKELLVAPATAKAGAEGYRQAWERARKRVAASGAGQESEGHLFRVALAVSGHYSRSDAQRARAVLETAIDLLADGALRDVLRCRLARYALLMNDVEAGAAWLAEVDPRPLHLEIDTEVRIAQALLAFRRKDYDAVLELLGRELGEVPILPTQGGLLPWALRGHALAGRGEGAAAIGLFRHVGVSYSFGNAVEVAMLFDVLGGPLSASVARRAMASGNRRVAGAVSGIFFFIVAAIVVPCCIPPACPVVACNGNYSAVIDALNNCPETRALLGDDITWAWGCSQGEGHCDSISWSMSVKGSRARGDVRFSTSRAGGDRWHLSGTVTTDEGSARICPQYQLLERRGD